MSFLTFYKLRSLKSKNKKKQQQQRANDKICLFIFWKEVFLIEGIIKTLALY